jgi:NAD(P)H-hydrate epimerase
MIPVLSRAQVRAFDAYATSVCSVPSLVLMENAGRGVADVIGRELGDSRASRFVVVCGIGNNGGDGFVVARHLATRGCAVDVHRVGSLAQLAGDARANHDALAGLGVPIKEVGEDTASLRADLLSADAAVDALFGTGLDRPIVGLHASVVEAINRCRKPVVSVDVPSGLDADTGVPLGVSVKAGRTVTFVAHKLGLLTPTGAVLAGKVHVVDIGVPSSLVDRVGHSALLLEPSDVARALLPRNVSAHKGSAGHVAIFAGSAGKVGAGLMASRAALRAGAGVVTLATWPESADAVEGLLVEAMTARLERDDLVGSVDRVLQGKRAVLVGPGFGTDEEARAVVEHILQTWQGPSVVDADALGMFAGRPEVFASSRGAPVLTPHPGELGKLLSLGANQVEEDRFGAITATVSRARSVVVLKGAHTLIGAPDERTVINASGNAALATAGAGDVLSGILGALLCSLDPFEAAWTAVHVHGRAADLWRDAHSDRGLLAHEIADLVPEAMASLARPDGLRPAG